MARILILGGGFGGLATATELRRLPGPELEIVVVDRRERVFIGLRVAASLPPGSPGRPSPTA